MKIHTKFQIGPPIDENGFIMPLPEMQIAEFDCHHCGSKMRVPVQEEYTDWKEVAEHYREAVGTLIRDFDQMLKDIEVMHQENPVAHYLVNEWKATLKDFDNKF